MVGDPQAAARASDERPAVFLVAVEESGDRLGAALMRGLRQRTAGAVSLTGVGGYAMAAEGLASLHPIADFSMIGLSAIPRRLPRVLGHLRETLRAIRRTRPDVLVVIDSPGYTLPLARFARRANPWLPIVCYVSPSVWAWRPQRARRIRRSIDHVMALLPFEPDVHRRLGGPPCSYVGHPLIEEIDRLRPGPTDAARRSGNPPVVLVLPGSRRGEIERLAAVFGAAIGAVNRSVGPLEFVVPTVPHLAAQVAEATAAWPVAARIVTEPAAKQAAFRVARAALAKSGTVTLELALAGVPMVTAYRVSAFDYAAARLLVKVPSVILANLVLGENVVPEFIQAACTVDNLATALTPLITDTPQRQAQIDAFARLDRILEVGTASPALRAADIVLKAARRPKSGFAVAEPNL